MRTIDGVVQSQLESPSRTDIVLCFLTVTDPARDEPARIVCEENGNVPRANGLFINYYLVGDLYYGLPYKFSRLTDDDRPARATLTVPAFDRRIMLWLQEMQNPARLRVDCYAASAWASTLDADNARSPSTTPKRIYLADLMWLRNVSAGGIEIVCEVGGYDFTQEPLGLRATQDLCPDLYR